jgi:hypothetical protein
MRAAKNDQFSQAAIFARVWESGEPGWTPELARYILGRTFSERDQGRMHELAEKNQEGRLTAKELEELDSFVKVADLLAILQSRARQFLKQSPLRRHG